MKERSFEYRMNISEVNCSGCGACIESCPRKCISMKRNAAGFLVASIEQDKCIQCGICIKKCSQKYVFDSEREPIQSFLAFNKNETERFQASSGGVFGVLAEMIISNSGVVYGAAFDENLKLRHKCASTIEEIKDLCGSKYLQSEVYPVFEEIKRILPQRKVLFVGTPCQVYALKQTLGDSPNLYTADLICHGAPSPGLFEGYKHFLEQKKGGSIIAYNFRSKEHANAIMSYTVKVTYRKKNQLHSFFMDGDEEPYTMRFISNALQGEGCYNCRFTNLDRQGDITLGDYWGFQEAHPEYKDMMGVSLVLVNSTKGCQLLEKADKLHLVETKKNQYLSKNNHLCVPPMKSEDRDGLYSAFSKMGFTKKFYNKYFLPNGYRTFIFKRRLLEVLAILKRKIK